MKLDMVCTCRREGMREVEDRRLRIFKLMNLFEMRDLHEAIVMSLAFDFECDAEVYVDQWFGISLKTPLLKEGLFIPCDEPHDGFAAVWEELNEKFGRATRLARGEKKMAMTGEDRLAVAGRISSALFSAYERANEAYEKHRESHEGPNDCPPCEDCEVLLSLQISARHALDAKWGSRSLDKCVERALEIS